MSHRWVPCKVFDGSCSNHRCGMELSGHKHCVQCGLVAFPAPDDVRRLEYLAYEDPKVGLREFEIVPDGCPLPTHLHPFRRTRRSKPPFRAGRRWSLFKLLKKPWHADAWLAGAARVLGAVATADSREALVSFFGRPADTLAILRPVGARWGVFVRVDRTHMPAFETRVRRDAKATLSLAGIEP
jgi:hypothetical protein